MYKDEFSLSPEEATFTDNLKQVPWLLTPIWGLISDNFLIFGYKRRSYLILSSILSMATYFIMGYTSLSFGLFLVALPFN